MTGLWVFVFKTYKRQRGRENQRKLGKYAANVNETEKKKKEKKEITDPGRRK